MEGRCALFGVVVECHAGTNANRAIHVSVFLYMQSGIEFGCFLGFQKPIQWPSKQLNLNHGLFQYHGRFGHFSTMPQMNENYYNKVAGIRWFYTFTVFDTNSLGPGKSLVIVNNLVALTQNFHDCVPSQQCNVASSIVSKEALPFFTGYLGLFCRYLRS